MSMTTKQWTKSDELQRKKFYLAEADGIVMPVPISFHSTTRSPSLFSYLFFLLGCISLCTLLFTLCCCCCCSTASSSLFFSIFFFRHPLLQLWKMQCLNYICALLHDPNAIIVQFWLVAGTLAQLCCCCSREWKKWTGKSIEINCRLAWK